MSAEAFKSIIDEAVLTVAAQKDIGSYAVSSNFAVDVSKTIAVGEDDISYLRMYPGEESVKHTAFRGLDFVPTHALEVVQMNRLYGRVARQTVFGANREGEIVRAMTPGSGISAMFGEYLRRTLDTEETEGLLGFMRAPHLDDGSNRALAMRLTPHEQTEVDNYALKNGERSADFTRRQQELTDAVRVRFDRGLDPRIDLNRYASLQAFDAGLRD